MRLGGTTDGLPCGLFFSFGRKRRLEQSRFRAMQGAPARAYSDRMDRPIDEAIGHVDKLERGLEELATYPGLPPGTSPHAFAQRKPRCYCHTAD